MKTLLIPALALAAAGAACFPAAGDRSAEAAADVLAIRRVLDLYFEGARTHRSDLFEKAFDVPNAHLKAVRRTDGAPDQVRVVPVKDAIAAWVRGEPQATSGRVLSIDVIDGKLATAKLEIRFKGRDYLDVMSLYKVSGRWKIVNKVYVSR